MNRGDSVYNTQSARIGRVLSTDGELLLVITTRGREQWPASDCQLMDED